MLDFFLGIVLYTTPNPVDIEHPKKAANSSLKPFGFFTHLFSEIIEKLEKVVIGPKLYFLFFLSLILIPPQLFPLDLIQVNIILSFFLTFFTS